MANLIALLYNWWNLYARLYDHTHHREAITSRPALLCGVGRLLRHGGQRPVKVSLQHEKSDLIAQAITHVSNTLASVNAIAEQWTLKQRWTLLLTYILRHCLGGKWLGELPPEAARLLSGSIRPAHPPRSVENHRLNHAARSRSFTFLGLRIKVAVE